MQAKLDLSDEQRGTLAAALRRYQGAFGALAKERTAINAALVSAATPGKDGLSQACALPSAASLERCMHAAGPSLPNPACSCSLLSKESSASLTPPALVRRRTRRCGR